VIAKNIHGLLAKRTRGRRGKHRKTEEAAHTREIHTRGQHTIFVILRRGESTRPHVGMGHIHTSKALSIAFIGTSNESIQSLPIHISRKLTLRNILLLITQLGGIPRFSTGAARLVPTRVERTYRMINNTSNTKTSNFGRDTSLVVGGPRKRSAQYLRHTISDTLIELDSDFRPLRQRSGAHEVVRANYSIR
jgi:hypothetical protein